MVLQFSKMGVVFEVEGGGEGLNTSGNYASSFDKAKLFAENFAKNSNLDISLPIFPSRTNLKLHSIPVAIKLIKNFIRNLDSSKASGPDCISVVVLKNCKLETSYIVYLAELFNLFNTCLKEPRFPSCW